jgi:hypothetical protein
MWLKHMNIIKDYRLLKRHIMSLATLGNCSCIALLPAIHGSICSFWKNISGHFIRFVCNHSLCTGSTVVGQCMEQLPNGYAFQRIGQTVSLRFPQQLHSYKISELNCE